MPKKKTLLKVEGMSLTREPLDIELFFVCRICLHKNGEKQSLFAPYQDSTASALISLITDINIVQGDGLPHQICQNCLLELETSINFRKKCEKSNAWLLQIVSRSSEFDDDHLIPEIKQEVYDNEVDDTDNLLLEDSPVMEQTTKIAVKKEQPKYGTKVQCHDCGELFKSKCKLRVHWKQTHNTYICPSCNRLFKSVGAFNKHGKYSTTCINPKEILVEGVGKNRIFKCLHCHYETRALPAIRLHAYIHNGKKPFKCDCCSMSFNQYSSLSAHKERRHSLNVKQITCQYCGKEVFGRSKIYKHLKSHSNETFQCDFCKKFLRSKAALIGHLKRHSGVKSYLCNLCDASYYTLSELCNHRRSRHTTMIMWHSCNLCAYKSKRKNSLQKHQAKHTGTNIACQKCGTFFESELKLQSHVILHLTEKKFSCPICLHRFHRKDSVRTHMRAKHKGHEIKPEETTGLAHAAEEVVEPEPISLELKQEDLLIHPQDSP